MEEFKREHREEIRYQTWLQYEFAAQWSRLKSYANERDIQIIGDIPIFVNHNSADVWSRPELFEVGSDGKPKMVSGVPTDYFSETGHILGNLLFNWIMIIEHRFSCGIDRLIWKLRLL